MKLLTRPYFWPLFWTQFLGAFNDNIFKNILVILITYQGISLWGLDPVSLVALSGGIFILPFFLFSAIAGQISERYQKATTLRLLKGVEVVVMSMAVVGFAYNWWNFLMLALFLMGAQSAFFGPIKYGILPDLVRPIRLIEANALLGASVFIAILLGTILGGTLGGRGYDLTLVACILLGVSCLGLLVALFERPVKVYDSRPVGLNLFTNALEILRPIWRDKTLFWAVWGVNWLWFLGVCLLSLVPALAKDLFHGEGGVATFFLSIFTVGMALGSALTNIFSPSGPRMGLVPVSAFFMGFFLLALTFICGLYAAPLKGNHLLGLGEFLSQHYALEAALCFFAVAIFGGLYFVSHMTFIQLNSSGGEVSKTIAGSNILNALSMVLASVFIIGLKFFSFSLEEILMTVALLGLLVSFLLCVQYREETLWLLAHIITHFLYRVEIRGKENLPSSGPYIICSNHLSFIDWLFIIVIFPSTEVRFIVDHRYYFIWPLTLLFRWGKHIPISRRSENEDVYQQAFTEMAKVLERKEILMLFPEGVLSPDGQMGRFMPGLAKILGDCPVPVVPVALKGVWGIWFSHSGGGAFRKWPRILRPKVTIQIGPPLSPEGLRVRTVEEQVSVLLN